MDKFNFTKAGINAIKPPKKGVIYYQDTGEKNLKLYVTANNIKTFFVRKLIDFKDERIILGQFPVITVDRARKLAMEKLVEISNGKNPNYEKKKIKDSIKFEILIEKYIEYSKKHKSEKTLKSEITSFNLYSKDWFNKRISLIKKEDVRKKHQQIHDDHGLYSANRWLSYLSSMYNKAISLWGLEIENPVTGIKKFKEKSRDRFLQPEELPRFFKALELVATLQVKNYVYLSLLTGARKSNVLSMRWEEISFENRTWRIPKTKNGEALILPLCNEALSLLKEIKESSKSEWVLESPNSKSGHLEEPKRSWSRVLKYAEIKDFRMHDLRRTLGSYQAINGANSYIIGKSLGHKSQASTAIYARLNLDPVRNSIETATNNIFKLGNIIK